VSSHYVLFCVSHDPAIVFGGVSDHRDWSSPDLALAAIADRTTGPAREHPHCDLLIGRYSGGLIEVCCSASRSNGPHHGSSHREDIWIDPAWLRLLALSHPGHEEVAELRSCWSRDVALRLRRLLCIDDLLPTHDTEARREGV